MSPTLSMPLLSNILMTAPRELPSLVCAIDFGKTTYRCVNSKENGTVISQFSLSASPLPLPVMHQLIAARVALYGQIAQEQRFQIIVDSRV